MTSYALCAHCATVIGINSSFKDWSEVVLEVWVASTMPDAATDLAKGACAPSCCFCTGFQNVWTLVYNLSATVMLAGAPRELYLFDLHTCSMTSVTVVS
eukprot:jgi/Chrzof1/5558/Cz16g07150.t1